MNKYIPDGAFCFESASTSVVDITVVATEQLLILAGTEP